VAAVSTAAAAVDVASLALLVTLLSAAPGAAAWVADVWMPLWV
jgi:hypothetical protein